MIVIIHTQRRKNSYCHFFHSLFPLDKRLWEIIQQHYNSMHIYRERAITVYPSEISAFTTGVSEVHVAPFYFYVYCVVDRFLSCCLFSADHCIVCLSPIYSFWLLLWDRQAFLMHDIFFLHDAEFAFTNKRRKCCKNIFP